MTLFKTYVRALGMLASEKWIALWLALANSCIALVQVAEPKLFGWVVDALAKGEQAYPMIALWAALGIFRHIW
jgi:ATP-binding cassette, subfamily B, beta-glucan exporter